MSGADIDPGLEALVAQRILRPWADQASRDLLLDAQRTAPAAKVWKTAEDERVRQTHQDADGQEVAENVRFILEKPQAGPTAHGQASRAATGGGQSGDIANKAGSLGVELAAYPRDESLSPGNRENCRCQSTPDAEAIARSLSADGVAVDGTAVRFGVSTGFNRVAESEFGDGKSPGLRWMGRALNEFASRHA